MKSNMQIIHHLLTHCGSLGNGESLIILADSSTLDIALAFQEVAQKITPHVQLMEIPLAEKHGEEPPPHASGPMLEANLIISLCQFSLAHSQARIESGNSGARFLSMPMYTWELLEDLAVAVDFKKQAPRVKIIKDAFTNGSKVHVTTQAGTDMHLDIRGRSGNYCPGFVVQPQDLGSPPDIESNVSPQEDQSEGAVVIDGSITCPEIGLLITPVILTVERGRIVRFESKNKEYVTILETIFEERGSKRRILSECGVGLNPAARLTGSMLTDEGTLGCMHFGFGSNYTMGGKNKVDFHLDFVFKHVCLKIDDVLLFKDGECLI